MIIHKITSGWVTQKYDSETGKCISQEFFAGDPVDYEFPNGDPIDPLPNEIYQPFDMVQPELEATDEQLEDWANGELGEKNESER